MTQKALSIQLLWQPGTPIEYIDVAGRSLRQAVTWLKMRGRIIVHDACDVSGLNMHLLFDHAREVGGRIGLSPGQADIRTVSGALRRYMQSQGPDTPRLYLLAADDYSIQEPEEEYVFGYTDYPLNCTASMYRYKTDARIADADRLDLFSTMIVHEFGHLINAADTDRGEALIDYWGYHCTNDDCVMRQRDDLPDFARDVLPAFRAGKLFCKLCRKDITRFMNTHYPLAAA